MYICQEGDPDQLELFEHLLPFAGKLDRSNRWIVLAHTLNWRELKLSYAKLFATEGRPGVRARCVLGTLILKHHFQVSDDEILQLIIEGPYLQYFIGLPQFTTTAPFEASSLARVRERLGEETFAEFEKALINTLVEKKLIQAKGLLVDATVYESEITYPTDCGLLEHVMCVSLGEPIPELLGSDRMAIFAVLRGWPNSAGSTLRACVAEDRGGELECV